MALSATLTEADTLKLLREPMGFSDREIGRALSVNPRSIKHWRSGTTVNADSREALFDLGRLAKLLADLGLPAANVHAWFFQRNGTLDDQRPIDVFAADGYRPVRAAIDAMHGGANG